MRLVQHDIEQAELDFVRDCIIAEVETDRRTLSLGSLVGFVALFGIASRNAILLISHTDHLVAEEGREWSLDTVVLAARERLTPIVMTALVTGLGILPLALQTGQAGREIQGPMAIVILGGLVSSTLISLLVLPAYFGATGGPRSFHRPDSRSGSDVRSDHRFPAITLSSIVTRRASRGVCERKTENQTRKLSPMLTAANVHFEAASQRQCWRSRVTSRTTPDFCYVKSVDGNDRKRPRTLIPW